MRLPNKLGLKLYCFIFAWISLGQLLSLTIPGTDICDYYQTMIAFHKNSAFYYHAAMTASVMTLLSLIPLILYAFNGPRIARQTFRFLLAARVIGEVFGHNYELQFVKATFRDNPLVALALVTLSVAILFPSYEAHVRYAFEKTKSPTAP